MWHLLRLSVLLFTVTRTCAKDCPTWLYPSGDQCLCGSTLETLVVCDNETQEVGVLINFCLTSSEDGSNISVVGRCIAAINHGKHRLLSPVGIYVKVLPNISDQEQQTCGYLNRRGQLCGKCKPNHFISAYSYDIKCHPCTSSLWSAILQYICIAYLPLTVFLCVVLVFRISVTSPAMNVPVLCCQLLSMPSILRVLLRYATTKKIMLYLKFAATVNGVWNLDFFRLIIPPVCLPIDAMQISALDYLVAVYPLLLLVCFYVLVTAHGKGCRLIVWLWRPFLVCSSRLRYSRNVRYSIIDAFASFLLLSYIKFLNTSIELLIYSGVRNEYGLLVGNFLYINGTVEFMGPRHMLYAILSLTVFLVVIILPLLLLCLYPMLWFQKCLNKCGLNSPGLRIFMQCFQGYYRDRTDGGRECRYFAAIYPAFRIAIYVMYGATLHNIFYLSVTLLCVVVSFAILIVQPYKKAYKWYNISDVLIILCLVVLMLGFIEVIFIFHEDELPSSVGYIVIGIFYLIPLTYLTAKVIYLLKCILVKKLAVFHFRATHPMGECDNLIITDRFLSVN